MKSNNLINLHRRRQFCSTTWNWSTNLENQVHGIWKTVTVGMWSRKCCKISSKHNSTRLSASLWNDLSWTKQALKLHTSFDRLNLVFADKPGADDLTQCSNGTSSALISHTETSCIGLSEKVCYHPDQNAPILLCRVEFYLLINTKHFACPIASAMQGTTLGN